MIFKYIAVVFLITQYLPTTSTTRTVKVSRGDGSTGGDLVENKECKRSICIQNNMTCERGSCCQCACPNPKPNYIVSKGLCQSNDEFKQVFNADCKYSFLASNKPLATLPLTESSGSKAFYDDLTDQDHLRIECDDTITIDKWQHLDAFGNWKDGDQKVFSVKTTPVSVGNNRNESFLTSVQWSAALDANKYAGVIIKIPLLCKTREVGCVLAKVKGEKTYGITNVPTTTAAAATTTPAPTPTSAAKVSTFLIPFFQNDSSINRQVDNNGDNNSNRSAPNAALAPALAVVGVLLFLMACIFAVVMYRRRQKRSPFASFILIILYYYSLFVYQDNPVYCDPALDEQNRRSQLGPLPTIPGKESAYQALDSVTRKSQDYENPIEGVPPGADYDNPPVNENKGSSDPSDYDNPPVQGTLENTSDYDNPPPVEGGDSSDKYDYDIPKNQAVNTADQNTEADDDTRF
ncbi:hypothetical protein QZH41_016214 [Actinostola sp. cb2023]|nr:hypothetical protein QZH41_016214 [Actinostola sp. cb2023]